MLTLLDESTGLHYPWRRVRLPETQAVIRENKELAKTTTGHARR